MEDGRGWRRIVTVIGLPYRPMAWSCFHVNDRAQFGDGEHKAPNGASALQQ